MKSTTRNHPYVGTSHLEVSGLESVARNPQLGNLESVAPSPSLRNHNRELGIRTYYCLRSGRLRVDSGHSQGD